MNTTLAQDVLVTVLPGSRVALCRPSVEQAELVLTCCRPDEMRLIGLWEGADEETGLAFVASYGEDERVYMHRDALDFALLDFEDEYFVLVLVDQPSYYDLEVAAQKTYHTIGISGCHHSVQVKLDVAHFCTDYGWAIVAATDDGWVFLERTTVRSL